jgi:hypothetical protein
MKLLATPVGYEIDFVTLIIFRMIVRPDSSSNHMKRGQENTAPSFLTVTYSNWCSVMNIFAINS